MFKIIRYGLVRFVYYVGLVLICGTIVGAVLFMLLGKLFGDYTYWDLLKQGAWVGFRFSGVWAGGIALVMSFMDAKRMREKLK